MKKAWLFWGGWEGHEPRQTTERFERMLKESGFETEVFDTLAPLADEQALRELDLMVFSWTMGEIEPAYAQNVCRAVASGVGLAGCHGGLCDAFRTETQWQFMTGGQWVAHPGDTVRYTVHPCAQHPIMEGIGEFAVESEQYYLHVDPAVKVLATTRFPVAPGPHSVNGEVNMPVAWVKGWGEGRVFYLSLGHLDEVFDKVPQAATIMLRGMLWAAKTD